MPVALEQGSSMTLSLLRLKHLCVVLPRQLAPTQSALGVKTARELMEQQSPGTSPTCTLKMAAGFSPHFLDQRIELSRYKEATLR